MNGRILAVDPGEKRIGIAVSDLTRTIANPLTVLKHTAREIDAATIATLAREQDAVKIVVGQALNDEGEETPSSRHAARLAEAIRLQTDIAVEMWDESGSTNAAQAAYIEMGIPRRKRGGHLDQIAATIILQSYLDAHS